VGGQPDAGGAPAFQLGFVSAVFDNIPLTSLAIHQGGYDWGMLAYAVGFGGSMMWFGSSAGVAVANLFPEARSVIGWVRGGWHVTVAYIAGFFVMLALVGWHPTPKRGEPIAPVPAAAQPAVTPPVATPPLAAPAPAPAAEAPAAAPAK
jgi:hypothetical protein